jgi:predicted phage terminase large subunit-like protein
VGNDYSVIATWAGTWDGDTFVLDVRRERWEFPDLISAIHEQVQVWEPLARIHTLEAPVVIEDQASGRSAIQTLRRRIPQEGGAWLPPLTVIPFATGAASKESRAEVVTPAVQGGRVRLREGARWVQAFIDEHAVFPNGTHDDQVDTTSIALGRRLQAWMPPEQPSAPMTVVRRRSADGWREWERPAFDLEDQWPASVSRTGAGTRPLRPW